MEIIRNKKAYQVVSNGRYSIVADDCENITLGIGSTNSLRAARVVITEFIEGSLEPGIYNSCRGGIVFIVDTISDDIIYQRGIK